jgi:mRNA interferase RelE/StbE
LKVRFEKSFAKDLENIREKALLKRVKGIINEVKGADSVKEINNLRKLKGYETFYRIKFGDYRVGIELDGNEMIFTRFLHRKEIYRFFP